MFKTLRSSINDLAIDIRFINTTTQNARDDAIQTSDQIRILNETIMAASYVGSTLCSNLTSLEMQMATADTAIQNIHAEIIKYSDRFGVLNESMTDYVLNLERAQSFGANITALEQNIGTIESSIQNNINKISSTILDVAEMNKSTSESISMLDSRLTNIAGTIYYLFHSL